METIKKTSIACTVILGFSIALFFLYLSRGMILYLVVALILAMAINPMVVKFQKWKMKRVAASLMSMFVLIAILTAILGVLIVPLVRQGIGFAQNLPALSQKLLTSPTLTTLDQKYHIADYLNQFSTNASQILLGGSTSIISIATNAISVVSFITIIVILTFLFLIEGATMWTKVLSLLSEKNKEVAERVGGRTMRAVGGFVSGNLFISLIAGVVTFITLLILDVPYKLSLAALVALFDIIPLVGASIATIVVGLVALTKGAAVAIIAVGVILIYQFVEGHIIQPVVYSRSINLSALFIVVASLLGAEVAGIVGVLLAIPVAAVVQILVVELYTFIRDMKV